MSKLPKGKPPICHGCLSADRNLQQLSHNTDLYFTLLDKRTLLDDATIQNVLLCWECLALLQKIQCFQKRIQKAQQYLEEHCYDLENLSDTKSLSSLNRVKNYEIDSTQIKSEEDKSVKVEVEIEKDEKVYPALSKIKEETEDLSSILEDLNDTYLYNNYDDMTESTHDDIKEELDDTEFIPKVGAKKSKKKYSRSLRHYMCLLDTTKVEKYISHLICTPNNLQKLKKDYYMKSFKKLNARLNNHNKKISSMKSKDDVKLAKSTTSACSFCQVEITLDTVNSHYEEHKLETYYCRLCGKTYDSTQDTRKHILNCHEFVYSCTECKQYFHHMEVFRKHIQTHKYICDHCKREFRTKKRLTNHMRFFHLPGTCSICNAGYHSGAKLRNHLRRMHVPRVVPASDCYCVECDKHYPHPAAYKAHLRSSVVHAPRRIYRILCPECGRVFCKKTNMTNHYNLVHLKKTRHYCDICDKYFSNGYGLRTHMRFVHKKEEKPRNKICDICGRGFHNQKILTNHIRTHTGERPYQCLHCPAAFAQRTAMMSHMRSQHKYLSN